MEKSKILEFPPMPNCTVEVFHKNDGEQHYVLHHPKLPGLTFSSDSLDEVVIMAHRELQKIKEKPKSELLNLRNVGPATLNDFQCLGISSIAELANQDPDTLYLKLQEITGEKHDPCVWDVFAAAIHEAQTGEREPWWTWTKVRKKRQLDGTFLTGSNSVY